MTDLGYTPPPRKTSDSNGAVPVTIVGNEEAEQKPQYPSLCFNGPQAEMAGLTKVIHGEEYEMKIRVKATRIGGYDYSYPGSDNGEDKTPVEFKVISADAPVKVAEGDGEGDVTENALTAAAKKRNGPRPPKGRALSPKEAGMDEKE